MRTRQGRSLAAADPVVSWAWTTRSQFSNAYWDTQTSGQTSSAGGTGLTTAQLQGATPISASYFSTATNLGDGTTSAFSGGANGLYPYLTSFFPSAVQAVSGVAYQDAGATPAASGAKGRGERFGGGRGRGVRLGVYGAAMAITTSLERRDRCPPGRASRPIRSPIRPRARPTPRPMSSRPARRTLRASISTAIG